MLKEPALSEHANEMKKVIGMVASMVSSISDAFIHNRKQLLRNMEKRLNNVVEEIAFSAAKADERMFGIPVDKRRPFLRYQSVLSHLKLIAVSTAHLAEAPATKVSDKDLFSDEAMDHIKYLFERQKVIIGELAESAANADKELLKDVSRHCREVAGLCLKFSNHHETRMVNGACLPKSAPLFLAIIDHFQTMIHHEKELVRLMRHRL